MIFNKLKNIFVLSQALLLAACGTLTEKAEYTKFTNDKKYPKSYAVYQDRDLLKKANPENTLIKVDTKTQRLKLMVDGRTAIDSPATTGSSRKKDHNTGKIKNKATPKGSFKIREKLKAKRSTIFGRLYKNGKLVYAGDKRNFKGTYDDYKGAALNYWLRLTDGGIGIHASRGIRRTPSSNGCIRIPTRVAPKLFASVGRLTEVKVD